MGWRNAIVALCALSTALPATHAWTYVWRDPSNSSFVESGSSDFPCTEINNPKGMVYEFDSEGDPVAILMYGNTNCSGRPGGEAWKYYSKPAGNDVRSFKIEDRTKASSSSTSATSMTTTHATTVTATPGPTTSAAESSGSSISGGAIAGAVVGGVAGVAIIAALLFFLLRRRKKAAGSGIPDTMPPPPMSQGHVSSPVDEGQVKKEDIKVEPPTPAPAPARAPVRPVELAGDAGVVELSDTHRVTELEDNSRAMHKP